MLKSEIRPVAWVVSPGGEILSEYGFRVAIRDNGDEVFVIVEHLNGSIQKLEIDALEWPMLQKAITEAIENINSIEKNRRNKWQS